MEDLDEWVCCFRKDFVEIMKLFELTVISEFERPRKTNSEAERNQRVNELNCNLKK